MSDIKTQPTDASVIAFLGKISHETKRKDAFSIHEMMQSITQSSPVMWGESIIGYGSYHYKYKTGREGDWFLCGFSPRKQYLSLYIMSGFGRHEELLAQLGKHKKSKACLYINKLSDVNLDILHEIITASVAYTKSKKWD